MKDKKVKILHEDPEDRIDSRYSSEQERITDGIALMEACLERM